MDTLQPLELRLGSLLWQTADSILYTRSLIKNHFSRKKNNHIYWSNTSCIWFNDYCFYSKAVYSFLADFCYTKVHILQRTICWRVFLSLEQQIQHGNRLKQHNTKKIVHVYYVPLCCLSSSYVTLPRRKKEPSPHSP